MLSFVELQGTVRESLVLTDGEIAEIPNGATASSFASITGPATGSAVIFLGAQATLFAAGSVGPGVEIEFGSPASNLLVAGQFLNAFAGTLENFISTDILDITSSLITAASITASGTSDELNLTYDGTALASLPLASWNEAYSVWALPDGIDGTLILAGSPAVLNRSGDCVRILGTSDLVATCDGGMNAGTLIAIGYVAFTGMLNIGTVETGSNATDVIELAPAATLSAQIGDIGGGLVESGPACAASFAGQLTLSGGYVVISNGAALSADGLQLSGGTLRLDPRGSASVGKTAGTAGTLVVDMSADIRGFGQIHADIANSGLIVAEGGTLTLFGHIRGAGTIEIGDGSCLFLTGQVDAEQDVVFGGNSSSTLMLFRTPAMVRGVISGFGYSDRIDIASGNISAADWIASSNSNLGTLDLGAAGSLVIEPGPSLQNVECQVALSPDGAGGTLIAMIPCFTSGTKIACPGGERAVESLRVGERVMTARGSTRLIKWIGHRYHTAEELAAAPQLWPVEIGPGALLPEIPRERLRISPQHGVQVTTSDGLRIVPAVALVDDVRIRRVMPAGGVHYIHIELGAHDIIVAEGAPVESFLDGYGEPRHLFSACSGEPQRLQTSRYPRLEGGRLLQLVQRSAWRGQAHDFLSASEGVCFKTAGRIETAQWLDGALEIRGWIVVPGQPAGAEVDILADNQTVGIAVANIWRPDLNFHAMNGGRAGFMTRLPLTNSQCQKLSLRPHAHHRIGALEGVSRRRLAFASDCKEDWALT